MTATRALLMVWDGLRPDLVSASATPELWRVAQRGVWFSRSHSVFPTLTRVNSAAIASGCLPGRAGIAGNSFCLPTTGPLAPFSTADAANLRLLERSDGLSLVVVDTLADRVHRAGGRTVVISSGSAGSALLQDPHAGEYDDLVVVRGLPEMHGRLERLVQRFGPVPSTAVPATDLDRYLTRVITEHVLPELDPMVLVFWHTDPDHSAHARGLAAPETSRGLRDADENLGAILAAYERLGTRATTDVVVTSDHGASTVTRRVRPAADFAGFVSEGAATENGGAGLFYVADSAALAAVLRSDYVGPVFTRDGRAGTFPLALVGLDGPRSPDLVCSFGWDEATVDGFPGTSVGTHPTLAVSHGTASPYDVRNVLVAEGPDFRQGWVDPCPVGVVDIAPTLAHVLRLGAGTPFEGRVLAEALRNGDRGTPAWRMEELTAAVSTEHGQRVQRVQLARIADASYLTGGSVDST